MEIGKEYHSLSPNKYPHLWNYFIAFFFVVSHINSGLSQSSNPIEINGKWGFINDKGVLVIDTIFVMAMAFNEYGIAPVVDDSGWVYIETNGKKMFRPFIYDNGADYFVEGLARFQDKNKIGFVNARGEVQIEALFDFVRPFSEGVAAFCSGCKSISRGEHTILKGGTWGYINKQGEIVLESIFDTAGDFLQGEAIVVLEGVKQIIDKQGNILKKK